MCSMGSGEVHSSSRYAAGSIVNAQAPFTKTDASAGRPFTIMARRLCTTRSLARSSSTENGLIEIIVGSCIQSVNFVVSSLRALITIIGMVDQERILRITSSRQYQADRDPEQYPDCGRTRFKNGSFSRFRLPDSDSRVFFQCGCDQIFRRISSTV